MLRGPHCSYVTVHGNETYLYFNDLRGDAERPGRRPGILRERRVEAASARCRCRRARSRLLVLVVETSGSHRTWTSSPPLRRRDSEPLRDQGSTDDRPRPPRPRQFDRRRITSSKRLRPAPRLAQPRGDTLSFPAL